MVLNSCFLQSYPPAYYSFLLSKGLKILYWHLKLKGAFADLKRKLESAFVTLSNCMAVPEEVYYYTKIDFEIIVNMDLFHKPAVVPRLFLAFKTFNFITKSHVKNNCVSVPTRFLVEIIPPCSLSVLAFRWNGKCKDLNAR